MPCGYDHKYTYSHIGYNLKATDMQAALGASQLTKLPEFIARRKANFAYLRSKLEPLQDLLVLPEATQGADPSWFGFPIGIRKRRTHQPYRLDPCPGGKEDRHPAACLVETWFASLPMKAASIA